MKFSAFMGKSFTVINYINIFIIVSDEELNLLL